MVPVELQVAVVVFSPVVPLVGSELEADKVAPEVDQAVVAELATVGKALVRSAVTAELVISGWMVITMLVVVAEVAQ